MTYSRRVSGIPKPYEIFSLTMRKEMIFADGIDEAYDNLERLQKENFNRIKIPEFTFKIEGELLIYECQFIKGEPIRSIADYNAVFEDLVIRDSDYSFDTYRPENYIKDWKGDIYAIDLDDYRLFPEEQRIRKWERSIGFYGHVVTAYRGEHQLDVVIFGEGQRQKKLKQLIESMFNAVVKELPGDFGVVVDGKHLITFEDSMDYLRDLYLETRAQLNLDDNRTNKYQYRKAEKATVLFDSNNRTSHIK